MWRKKHKKTNNNYYDKKQWEDIVWTLALIVAVFLFLEILFWLWVILLTIWIIYWTHKLNEIFDLYDTEYSYWAIITFLVSASIILFWWSQIAYNMWKIYNTFWWWAIESSDYLRIGHSRWKINIEPNTEWMLQKAVIESLTSTWNNLK
jgi:hypothetical protein